MVRCNKRDMVRTDNEFRFTVTDKTYFIKSKLSCDSSNVIYYITCSNCREQYVGSVIVNSQI